jgi:Uma2 family endonuclease
MSIDEYLAWEAQQEEKHELIDGLPVRRRLRMMAGGTVRHALIAMNIGAWLRPRLRSRRCAPYGSDLKVLSPTGAFRYPDVTVDCSPKTGRATFAQDPRVVMEVLSAANDTMAVTRLMHDYQAIETVTAIVFFSQDGAYAQVFARTDKGWRAEEARGLEVSIDLPGLDLTLPLAEVYEGVTFDDPPPPSD